MTENPEVIDYLNKENEYYQKWRQDQTVFQKIVWEMKAK
jgi:protease II